MGCEIKEEREREHVKCVKCFEDSKIFLVGWSENSMGLQSVSRDYIFLYHVSLQVYAH